MEQTIPAEILTSCLEIHKARDKQYGSSEKSFSDIVRIMNRSARALRVDVSDVALFNIATKEARYFYMIAHPEIPDCEAIIRDTVIDWINYIAIMENIRLKNKDVKDESSDA